MKVLRLGLRFWMTLTSVFSFLVGWIILAHAPKPVQSNSTNITYTGSAATVPAMTPLPPLDFGANAGGSGQSSSPFTIIQPSAPSNFAPAPIFRTGGS